MAASTSAPLLSGEAGDQAPPPQGRTPSSSALSLESVERETFLAEPPPAMSAALAGLGGASMSQTLANIFVAMAGHSLLSVTQTEQQSSITGIAVLSVVLPLAVDRTASMLLEVSEVTRCTSLADVAQTVGGRALRLVADVCVVLFGTCQFAGCARVYVDLLPGVLATVAGIPMDKDSVVLQIGCYLVLGAVTLVVMPMVQARRLHGVRAASFGSAAALVFFVASIALYAASMGKRKLRLALALTPDVLGIVSYLRMTLLWCISLQGHSVLPTLFAELRRSAARDPAELEHKLRHSRFVTKRTKMRWLLRLALVGCGLCFFLVAIASRLSAPAGAALSLLVHTPPDTSTASIQIAGMISLLLGLPLHGILATRTVDAVTRLVCSRSQRLKAGPLMDQPPPALTSIALLLSASGALGLASPPGVFTAVYNALGAATSALLLFALPAGLSLNLRRWQQRHTPTRFGAAAVATTRLARAGSLLRALELRATCFLGLALALAAVLLGLNDALGVLPLPPPGQ